jgi:hypothetical protein
MSDPRYLVLDQDGMVVGNVVGFVDTPEVGFLLQVDDLMHVGMYWVYDAVLDDFTNPYGSMPPAASETKAPGAEVTV